MPSTVTKTSSSQIFRKFQILKPSDIRQRELEFHANSTGSPYEGLSAYEFTRSDPTQNNSILDQVANRMASNALKFMQPPVSPCGFFTSDVPEQLTYGYRNMFFNARRISQNAQSEGLSRIFLGQKNTQKKIICAPTSRIEDHPVSDKGFKMLIDGLVKDELGRQKFIEAISNGPEDGEITFKQPKDVYEAVGSIARWLILSDKQKLRIRFSTEIREEIWKVLDAEGYKRKLPMVGGVPAFCSQLLAAQGHDVTMYNEDHMIAEFAQHFNSDFKVFSNYPNISTMGELLEKHSKSSPGHFSISLNHNDVISSLGVLIIKSGNPPKSTIVDTATIKCIDRDIVISGARFPVGFTDQIPDERLLKVGNEMDLGLFSGFQYPEDTAGYDSYFRGINLFSKGTAAIAIEYSEPRCAKTEVELYGLLQLKKHKITAIACNTGEAYDLLKRLRSFHDTPLSDEAASWMDQLKLDENFWKELNSVLARLPDAKVDNDLKHAPTSPWEDVPIEDSIWLYGAAKIIQKLTDIPFVRVRGRFADVTLASPNTKIESPEEIVKHLTFSRNQAAQKSGSDSGNIRNIKDESWLECVPQDNCLASNIRLGESISFSEPKELGVVEKLARDWYLKLPTGHWIFLAIPHEFIRRKNTVSAGDTMAATAWSGMADYLKVAHKFNKNDSFYGDRSLPPEVHVG